MDRGFLACGTDVDLVTHTMLIQKLHNAAEARQVSHEAPERHAVSCVLENVYANGLGRVLLKEDVGSAAQTLVDPVWVGRGERTVAEKSSKYLRHSSGVGENDVRKIKSSANINDSVQPGEFGCRANSKRHCSAVGCWMYDTRASSLREASQCARSVEDEKIQRCVDTGRWNSGSWEYGSSESSQGQEPRWVARTRMTSARLRSARRVSSAVCWRRRQLQRPR